MAVPGIYSCEKGFLGWSFIGCMEFPVTVWLVLINRRSRHIGWNAKDWLRAAMEEDERLYVNLKTGDQDLKSRAAPIDTCGIGSDAFNLCTKGDLQLLVTVYLGSKISTPGLSRTAIRFRAPSYSE
jgi:hypothetical protein